MNKFFKSVQRKWLYSFVGFWTVIREEKSIWVYLIALPIFIGLGVWVKLNYVEWSLLVLLSFLVICVEVINTAIEATVDTISFQYNVKVKKIKDIAAGATLVISLGAIIVLLLIFVPKIQAIIS